MPQIIVENLVKTFRVAEREPGTWGAIRSLMRRRYRNIHALEGVSFSLEAGELVGYIGPNGAGKSTTITLLLGPIRPSGGRDIGRATTTTSPRARRCATPRAAATVAPLTGDRGSGAGASRRLLLDYPGNRSPCPG